MEHDGEGVFNVAFGLVGQGGKIETHFLTHSMSDETW